jgi:hypothetical protein
LPVLRSIRRGKRILDNGPDESRHGHPPHPHKKEEETVIDGIVRAALHGPKGETRGALLEDGTIIRFPKHAADKFSVLLKKGKRVAAKGSAITAGPGMIVDAHAMGATTKSLRKIGKPSKH